MKSSVITVALAGCGALADQPAWAQCGGEGWTGGTTCVSGYTCVVSNAYYSQCVPGAGTTLTTSTRAATTSAGATATKSATPDGKLSWVGASESGAEFGQGTYPGVWGKDFIFPDSSTIQVGLRHSMHPPGSCRPF